MIDLAKLNFAYCQKETYHPKFLSDGNIDVADLIHQFQNLATKQIESFSLGEKFEKENSLLYVVLRYKGYFLSPLKKDEEYTLYTYPTLPGPLQLYRYAFLLNKENKVVFYLISLWVMMDKEKRRIASAKKFREVLAESIPDFSLVPPFDEEKLVNFSLDMVSFRKEKEYQVKKEDIDSNGHMNNTVYLRISQPESSFSLSSFEFDYEKECFENDVLLLSSCRKEKEIIIKGEKEDSALSFKGKYLFS